MYRFNPTIDTSSSLIDTALNYIHKAEVLSRALRSKSLIAESFIAKSKAMMDVEAAGPDSQIGLRQKARLYINEALSNYQQSGDKLEKAEATFLLADTYYNLDSLRLLHFQSALEMYRELGMREGIAKTLVEIAWIIKLRGRIREALHICSEALAIQESIQDKTIGHTYYITSILDLRRNKTLIISDIR